MDADANQPQSQSKPSQLTSSAGKKPGLLPPQVLLSKVNAKYHFSQHSQPPARLYEERMAQVCMLLAKRFTDRQIVEHCHEEWSRPDAEGNPPPHPVSPRSVTRYIQKARERIRIQDGGCRDEARATILSFIWSVILDPNATRKDLFKATKELALMFGVYAPNKTSLTNAEGQDINLATTLRDAVLAAEDASELIDQMRQRQIADMERRAAERAGERKAVALAGPLHAPANGHALGNGHSSNGNGHANERH